MSNPNEIACRPRDALVSISRRYPGLWKYVDSVRAMRGKGRNAWPECCFLPCLATVELIERFNPGGADIRDSNQACNEAVYINALAAWRVTQGVYRFDKTIYEEVRKTPFEGNIPASVLCFLPEWCIYIETPDLMYAGEKIHGVWVYVDWGADCDKGSLHIVLDTSTPIALFLELSEEPIAKQLERIERPVMEEMELNAETVDAISESLLSFLSSIVSLVLYLCSQSAEIGDGVRRPINPTAKRINGGEYRLFPPNQVTTWGVGVRIGAALRRATEYASSGDGEATVRNAPRGHIRRAHWHGFRSGPTKTADGNTVNTSDRKFEVRWLPPLAINLGDLSDLPSTIRTVN